MAGNPFSGTAPMAHENTTTPGTAPQRRRGARSKPKRASIPQVVTTTRCRERNMNNDAYRKLQQRIEDRTAHIGILGLGYVGLPLARAFCQAGFAVNGFDVDVERIEQLNKGESPLTHFSNDELNDLVERGVFFATDDFKLLRRMDVAIVCVPTPLNPARDPDLSHVRDAVENIRRYLNDGMLVVLESGQSNVIRFG